ASKILAGLPVILDLRYRSTVEKISLVKSLLKQAAFPEQAISHLWKVQENINYDNIHEHQIVTNTLERRRDFPELYHTKFFSVTYLMSYFQDLQGVHVSNLR
ncbi:9921_t:CDS:2, partial [Funneliformis caledonium]